MLKTIKTDELTVSVETLGAEIKSIRNKKGNEFMWEGDPAVWSGTAPIMFPICSGLVNDTYTYRGKEYKLTKHGFAKMSEFEIESESESEITMLLRSNSDTLAVYPFEFEFRVNLKVEKGTLLVKYIVKNLNDDTMYFSVGAHEAYATPEGIEEYDVVFDKKETLVANELDGNLLLDKTQTVLTDSTVFPLEDKYFAEDALVFLEHNSDACTLVHRGGTRRVRIEFPGFDHLLIWHKYGAKYICIEPWNGITQRTDSDGTIENKYSIRKLAPGAEYGITHTITPQI